MTLKEAYAAYAGQQHGDAPHSGRTRKPVRSRGAAPSDAPRKHQRAGEEEATCEDVLDMIAQVHLELSTQLEARVRDLGSSTYCILFLPKIERHGARNANHRQDLQRHGGKQARSGKRKCTHLVLNWILKATERIRGEPITRSHDQEVRHQKGLSYSSTFAEKQQALVKMQKKSSTQ